MPKPMQNALYYGDNLDVLRESIASESINLVYLDPPFNSNANYKAFIYECHLGIIDPKLEVWNKLGRWRDQSPLKVAHYTRGEPLQLTRRRLCVAQRDGCFH